MLYEYCLLIGKRAVSKALRLSPRESLVLALRLSFACVRADETGRRHRTALRFCDCLVPRHGTARARSRKPRTTPGRPRGFDGGIARPPRCGMTAASCCAATGAGASSQAQLHNRTQFRVLYYLVTCCLETVEIAAAQRHTDHTWISSLRSGTVSSLKACCRRSTIIGRVQMEHPSPPIVYQDLYRSITPRGTMAKHVHLP